MASKKLPPLKPPKAFELDVCELDRPLEPPPNPAKGSAAGARGALLPMLRLLKASLKPTCWAMGGDGMPPNWPCCCCEAW